MQTRKTYNITTIDIANEMRVARQSVTRWIRRGRLKAIRGKNNRQWLICEDDYRAFKDYCKRC